MRVKESYLLLEIRKNHFLWGNFSTWREHGIINAFPSRKAPTDWLGFSEAITESAAYNYSLMSEEKKRLTLEAYLVKAH